MLRIFVAVSLLLTGDLRASGERSIAWEIHAGAQRGGVVASAGEESESFEAIGVSWSAASQTVFVRVRASADRIEWSDWITLAIDGDLTNPSEGRYLSAITHFGAPKRYLEYSFSGPVDRVTVTMFPPASSSPERERLTTESIPLGSLTIRSRAEWGCPDGEDSRWMPAYTTVTHAVVHHTAGANSVQDWDAELRNIWYYHTITNGWGDIGYNFLIDPNGVIYEGRAGGAGAIGAHFSCRNSNTAGVALLGTFTNAAPTDAALQSLQRLFAELCRRNSIDPTAVMRHPPSGLNLPTVLGHRDGNVPGATCTITECPGNVLYSMLPAIRTNLTCRPVVDLHPSSMVVRPGQTATLSVVVRGAEPLAYQWYADGSPIADATGSTLIVSPATTTSYRVRIQNACGIEESAAALVSVGPTARRRSAGH